MENKLLDKNHFTYLNLGRIILVILIIRWDASASHITQSENTTVFHLNHVYTGTLDSKHGNFYRFNLDQNLKSRYRLRVHILHPINETSLRYPLQVSSEPTSRFSVFNLPYEIDDDVNISEMIKSPQLPTEENIKVFNYHVGAERTLCTNPYDNELAVITIKFHTSSWFSLNYQFVLMHDNEMLLNDGIHVSAPSLSSPTFYKRYWNNAADKISIQVTFPLPPPQKLPPPIFLRQDDSKKDRFKRNSNFQIQTEKQSQDNYNPLYFSNRSAEIKVDFLCLKISIRKLDCPVDSDSKTYEFQTIIFSSGLLTIELSRDFMDGFILIMQPHASEEKCTSMWGEDEIDYMYAPVKWTESEEFENDLVNFDPYWNHKTFQLEQIPSTLMNPMHFYVGLNVSSANRRWNPLPSKYTIGLKTTTSQPLPTTQQPLSSSTLPPVTSLKSTPSTENMPIFRGLHTSTTFNSPNDTELPSDFTISPKVVDPKNSTYSAFFNPTLSLSIPIIISILLLIIALISVTVLVRPLYDFHLPLTRQMSTRSANEKASYAKALRPANKCSTFFILVTFYTVPLYHFTDFFVNLPDLIKNNMCTPNSGCTFSLGQIQDFNHLLSNIPYVLLGLGFYFCVQIVENALVTFAQKEASQAFVDVNENRYHTDFEKVDESFLDFQHLLRSTANTSPVYSSPSVKSGPREARDVVTLAAKMVARFLVSFGIFRALAIAMVMEGLLSAAFSFCPNHNTYKFDNGFLIYLAILIIFKFYHFRHVRVFNELQTIGLLGVVKITLVIGAVFEGFLGTNVYFMGTIFFITFAIILVSSFYYRQSQEHVYSMQEKFLFPLIMIITSGGVMAFWFAFQFNFAQYFLYQVTLCSLAYRIFYGFMKVCHSEFRGNGALGHFLYVGIWCFITVLIVYIFSGTYHKTLSDLSVTKVYNKECITWLPNQDVDDITRFLSAVVMFVSLFDLILVDDYVLTTPKSKIKIF